MDLVAPDTAAGERLDRYLAEALPGVSRSRIQQWIRAGRVLVDEVSARSSTKLHGGESIEVEPAPAAPLKAFPEPIPLDVLYEDTDLAAIDKPAGMTVHAGAGEESRSGTLVNALLYRFDQGLAHAEDEIRPGIVHRLDRYTSGVILVAKNDIAHRALAEMFENRKLRKTYLALVHGRVDAEKPAARARPVRVDGEPWARIEAPIGRDPRRRHRMAVVESGRPAVTDYRPLRANDRFSLLEVRIHTGRTHQIRVHLASIGRPVVGDRMYGAPAGVSGSERFFLHAWRLEFEHPLGGAPMRLEAPLPRDFAGLLASLQL